MKKTKELSEKSGQVYARLGKDLSATSNAVMAADIILTAANELIGWEASYLVLYDPDSGEKPRPLLAIDIINDKRIVEYDIAPERPTENMLRAIRENGFILLYDEPVDVPVALAFGDLETETPLSLLFVPIHSGERTIGVLSIQSYKPNAYTESSLEILKALANHCAGALERVWAQEALTSLAERLKALYQATHAISASLDMEQLCEAILSAVEKVMPCDDFIIDGYNEQTNEIVPIYAVEYPRKRIFTDNYFADHGMAGQIVHTRMPVLLNSTEEMNNSGINFEWYGSSPVDQTQSILAVPMLLHDRVTGMISAQSYKENAYTRDDQYLLELLAAHAAITIENARLFEKVQLLADVDSLTGIFNRRKFFDMAEREFNRAMRYKKPLSVIMLDVDEFKKFNDRFGHNVGDMVLCLVASVCKSTLRDADILGRLGGEEFAVLLPETDESHAIVVANRLRKVVEEAEFSEAEPLHNLATNEKYAAGILKVTVSVGVATYDEACRDVGALIDRADHAMYSVKYAGKNQISIWNDGAN